MRLRDLTIEELFDLEEETIGKKERDGSVLMLIRIYEELFRKIRSDKRGEYGEYEEAVKQRLISYLIQYGTHLKSVYRKDDESAEMSLKKALRLDGDLPIAYYRLGFLRYKKKDYLEALRCFHQAIQTGKNSVKEAFQLNKQQLYNARVYLVNCCLYLTEESTKALKEMETDELAAKLPPYEMSDLFALVSESEARLNTFVAITNQKRTALTLEEAERLMEGEELSGHLILYFSDRSQLLLFNGEEVELSVNQAEMLRYLFLHTSEASPATKHHFGRILDSRREDGEINTNTYTQNIRRIREKIADGGANIPVIENKRHRGETAYFYNGKIPYCIIARNDYPFILEG